MSLTGRSDCPNKKGAHKMNIKTTVFALLCLAASSCLAQDVRYNYAGEADFSKFKTYQWGESPAEERLDSLTDRQLRGAVDDEMAKKGFVRIDNGPADLLLVYQPSLHQEKEFTTFPGNWGYGRGWGRGWYGVRPITTTRTSTIRVGEFALDIYDRAKHELVWRGVASKTLDPNMKPDKWQKTIRGGAEKLLKYFPPLAKKGT
jgi:hypothetical protein